MKPTTALIWKEWREQRWFLFAGLGFFLALPPMLVLGGGGFEALHIYLRVTADMVLCFGGVMAVFVGVGAATRDSGPSLDTFWRSRPVSPLAAFFVKYAAGLMTVLLACSLPILVIMAICYAHSLQVGELMPMHPLAFAVLGMHTFCWALIFSLAFLLGSLVRRASHAAVLSVGAGLLVYFLPIVLPPLGSLSVFNLMERANVYGTSIFFSYAFRVYYVRFVGGMLATTAASVALALCVTRRGWRLRLDLRLMCWTLGGILLILFGATAFQLRANLVCERTTALPSPLPGLERSIRDIVLSGRGGLLLLYDAPSDLAGGTASYSLCRWDPSGPNAVTAPRIVLSGLKAAYGGAMPGQLLWSSERPQRAYFVRRAEPGFVLCTTALGAGGDASLLNELELKSRLPVTYGYPQFGACLYKQMIYVCCADSTFFAVSIEDPDAPRIFRQSKVSQPWYRSEGVSADGRLILSIDMVPSEDLSLSERLDVTVRLRGQGPFRPESMAGNGDLLVVCGHYAPSVYRLMGFRDDRAEFVQIGRREATPLEQLVGTASLVSQIVIGDGMVYVVGSSANLVVYDIRQPEHPRRLYHYVASDQIGPLALLPDGRMLVGCRDWSKRTHDLLTLALPESTKR